MDQAIYDTFARMSQPWINNIPEVDWHGANGSIQISGEAAASRYTEARLSKASEEGLLYNIQKHNVPMKLNFSEDEEWPEVFPAILPRLMINGCQGIGSTIANVWVGYNLKELYEVIEKYVKTNKLDSDSLYPDFPTGGTIINKADLPTICKTGKGKVILRAKTEIRGNTILVTEIPYQVYVEPLIEQIKKLVADDGIEGIVDILNKSDRKRLLIEITCESSPLKILNQLYKKTNLQKTFSVNQFALVGKTPKLLNLKEYLDVYLEHNYECIRREYQNDYEKASKRLEIVLGLIKALEDIDNIIALIKRSESSNAAVENLILKYDFSQRQAQAIVDMKLGRLAKLEAIALNKEREELTSNIENFKFIIENKQARKDIFLERLELLVKKYGVSRKTEVIQVDEKSEEPVKKEIIPEKVVVVLNRMGYIKRIPNKNFKVQNRNGRGVRTSMNVNDVVLSTISTTTADSLMVFTNRGKVFRINVVDIAEGTNANKGQHLNSLIELENGEEALCVTSSTYENNKYVVFFTKNGIVKKSKIEEYLKIKRKGVQAIKLVEGDSLANVVLMNDEDIMIFTKRGMSILFESKTISPLGRVAKGVKGIKLNEGDEVAAGVAVKEKGFIYLITKSGSGKVMDRNVFAPQGRGGKGVFCLPYKSDTEVAGVFFSESQDNNILLIGIPNSIYIKENEIPLTARTAGGNILIKGSQVLSAIEV